MLDFFRSYETHDFLIHSVLVLSALAQLIPGLYSWRICRITGWTKYWSTSWIVFTAVMFWIMLRRAMVAITYDYSCDLNAVWIFDEVISTGVTSIGLTVVAILKYKFYRYWLEASVTRIDKGKKEVADSDIFNKKEEFRKIDAREKTFRDQGPDFEP